MFKNLMFVLVSYAFLFSTSAIAGSFSGKLTKVQSDGDGGFFIKADPALDANTCTYSGIYFRTPEMTEKTLNTSMSIALAALSIQSNVVIYYDEHTNNRCYATVIAINRK